MLFGTFLLFFDIPYPAKPNGHKDIQREDIGSSSPADHSPNTVTNSAQVVLASDLKLQLNNQKEKKNVQVNINYWKFLFWKPILEGSALQESLRTLIVVHYQGRT